MIGVLFWAHADEEVAGLLAEGARRLRPQDWDCRRKGEGGKAPGVQIWVAEVIAPFGGAKEMVRDLKARVYPNDEVRFLSTGAEGQKVEVV